MEQFLVLVQQGLAFRGVGDDQRDPGFEFHRRRKAAPAGADDAELLKAIGGRSMRMPSHRLSWRDSRICRHLGLTSKSVKIMRLTLTRYCIVSFNFNQELSTMKCLIPNIGSTSFKYRRSGYAGRGCFGGRARGADRPAGRRVCRLSVGHPQVPGCGCRRRQGAEEPVGD